MSMSYPPAPPAPPTGGASPHGGTIVRSAWSALRQDRELLALPVIGALVALLAVLPLVLVALIPEDGSAGQIAIFLAVAFVGAIVSTFFAVALAAGAHERMNGGDPTIGSSVRVAWSRKRGVILWALLSTTVGLVLRAIEERFKFVGSLIRFAGDVAWTLASLFVVPVIAANDVGPIEALKLSANMFRQRWNSAVRVQLRLGLYALGLVIGGIGAVILVVVVANASVPLAVVVGVALGAIWLLAALVLSALGAYSRVALYRYASGLATPGFSRATLESAVSLGRRR